MKKRSAFDIIGPVMIGPSSSHTAGALRIARIAARILGEPVAKSSFTLYGSFAETYQGHGTDRALLAGILGYGTDYPGIREAYGLAESQGLEYIFQALPLEEGMHPNTVAIAAVGSSGKTLSLSGKSVGGGEVVIREINGISVEFTGEYPTLIVQQWDRPGVAAHITGVLAEENVNIVTIRMYREHRGTRAFTILETDEGVEEQVIEKIGNNPNITEVFSVVLGE